ncbi:MAG TPA: amino acid adenylation domain-containing protein [Candidatus Angelobacter sp.]|nr:amino acid adenylation domain-containing protein [Candidatus Angelobacter sp.]
MASELLIGAATAKFEQQNFHTALTEAQRQIWALAQLELKASVAYNVCYAVELHGKLHAKVLQEALQAVVDRHDSLRCCLHPDGETLAYRNREPFALPLEVIFHLTPSQQRERLGLEASKEFDLSQGPLFRAKLFRTGEEKHILLLISHHIIVDGMSMHVVLRELGELYSAAVQGRPVVLNDAPLQSHSYHLRHEETGSPKWLAAENYWLEQFQHPVIPLNLPAERPQRSRKTFNGALETLVIEREIWERLVNFSAFHGCTPFMTLLMTFSAFIQRVSGQNDFAIGVAVSDRSDKLGREIVGYRTNLLPFRMQVDAEASVEELLESVSERLLSAFEHRNYTLPALVRKLSPVRVPGRSPILDITFNFDKGAESFDFHGIDSRLIPVPITAAKFDLDVNVLETRSGLLVLAEYNTDLFDKQRIERFLGLWKNLLQAALDAPATAIGALAWLSDDDWKQAVTRWNQTEKHYEQDEDKSVPGLFELQASRTPNAIAVGFEGVQWSYAELNRRANQLGHYLRSLGVRRETRVGVYLDRGLDLVAAMLAIWKAEGVYVPLNSAYPKERLAYILEDAGTQVLLTEQALQDDLKGCPGRVSCIDVEWEVIEQQSEKDLEFPVKAKDLAYLMYTSGSTGKPKGAMVEHGGMRNHLCAKIADLGLTAEDIIAQNAPASFDVSIWQMMAVLLVGGQVQIISEEIARDAFSLLREVQRLGSTVLETVPAMLGIMIEQQDQEGEHRLTLGKLRWMISNAEALPTGMCYQWYRLYPKIGLINAYGPTECSDDIAHHYVKPEDQSGLKYAPLGTPLGNLTAYVLDEWMQPAPNGVAGEIHIGGSGVGRGYCNRPALTAERFRPDPFGKDPGARLYATGDWARRLPDGTLEFLGRIDHQVKLRGLRIELTEIEAILNQNEDVRQCAVIVQEDGRGDQQLVAFVVPKHGGVVDSGVLRNQLKRYLPDHMVPDLIVVLDKMPLTTNEKIDREALSRMQGDRSRPLQPAEPPRNPCEEALVKIWCEALGLSGVGIHENFFELGGHSLLATRMVSRVRNEFKIDLPLRVAFESPTITELAEVIGQLQNLPGTAINPIRSSRIERAEGPADENILVPLDRL